jgi:hypothetical protein
VVEIERLKVVNANNLENVDPTAPGAPVVPMSVWWQIPQYFLIGEQQAGWLAGRQARGLVGRQARPPGWPSGASQRGESA